jgi:hypothetical protein
MLKLTITALVLVAITVAIHAVGLALLAQWLLRPLPEASRTFWPMTRRLVAAVWCLLLIHGLEVSLWAAFYLLWELFPNAEAAFYFSGVTYATIGYGDLVLPSPWRMFSPIEGLTGILMCGASGAFLIAVFTRLIAGAPKS